MCVRACVCVWCVCVRVRECVCVCAWVREYGICMLHVHKSLICEYVSACMLCVHVTL